MVQSEQFKHTNLIHVNPTVAAEHFDRWAADEIVVIDVSRTQNKREKFLAAIESLSKVCFVPITVGGWIRSADDIRDLLRRGADKIIVNTEAVRNPGLITRCARMFGSQCMVVSVDVRGDTGTGFEVYIDRGREATGMKPGDWACGAQELGAGEIFLTSIDREGTRRGYDIDLLKAVSSRAEVPVIAFGGVSTWDHLVEGIKKGGADAVAVANVLHYSEGSLRVAKNHMRESGIEVR